MGQGREPDARRGSRSDGGHRTPRVAWRGPEVLAGWAMSGLRCRCRAPRPCRPRAGVRGTLARCHSETPPGRPSKASPAAGCRRAPGDCADPSGTPTREVRATRGPSSVSTPASPSACRRAPPAARSVAPGVGPFVEMGRCRCGCSGLGSRCGLCHARSVGITRIDLGRSAEAGRSGGRHAGWRSCADARSAGAGGPGSIGLALIDPADRSRSRAFRRRAPSGRRCPPRGIGPGIPCDPGAPGVRRDGPCRRRPGDIARGIRGRSPRHRVGDNQVDAAALGSGGHAPSAERRSGPPPCRQPLAGPVLPGLHAATRLRATLATGVGPGMPRGPVKSRSDCRATIGAGRRLYSPAAGMGAAPTRRSGPSPSSFPTVGGRCGAPSDPPSSPRQG